MRVVVQRVRNASVSVRGEVVSSIDRGYALLVGISAEDTIEIMEKVAKKVVDLRIFEDEDGKMNRSIEDAGGEILSVSQFTLMADVKKGRRPSFIKAMGAEEARDYFLKFNEMLERRVAVKSGVFQEEMLVSIANDGPVTIIVDSDQL